MAIELPHSARGFSKNNCDIQETSCKHIVFQMSELLWFAQIWYIHTKSFNLRNIFVLFVCPQWKQHVKIYIFLFILVTSFWDYFCAWFLWGPGIEKWCCFHFRYFAQRQMYAIYTVFGFGSKIKRHRDWQKCWFRVRYRVHVAFIHIWMRIYIWLQT